MKANRTKYCCAGFTLFELLIAIALMDIIALTLYSSMYIGFRAKNTSVAVLKPYQMVTPAFEIIREDLSNVMTPDGILAGVFVGEDAAGDDQQDADTVSFYGDGYCPSEDEIASNVIKIEYLLEQDTERQQIVLKRLTTKNLLAPTEAEPEEEIICRGLTGFDVKYYDGSSWLDSWDSSEEDSQLPKGVQVSLTILEQQDTNRTARLQDNEKQYTSFTRTFVLSVAGEDMQEEGQTES